MGAEKQNDELGGPTPFVNPFCRPQGDGYIF